LTAVSAPKEHVSALIQCYRTPSTAGRKGRHVKLPGHTVRGIPTDRMAAGRELFAYHILPAINGGSPSGCSAASGTTQPTGNSGGSWPSTTR
jgi:hypothetical protein